MSETVQEINFLKLSYQANAYVGRELTGQRWKKHVFRCIKNTLWKVDWLFFKTDRKNLRRNFSSGSHFQKISAHGGREDTAGQLENSGGNTGKLLSKCWQHWVCDLQKSTLQTHFLQRGSTS